MKPLIFLSLILPIIVSCTQNRTEYINLTGEWQFQTDPDDQGIVEKWFDNELADTIHLPGSMAENGKGDEVTLKTKWTGGIQNPEWYKDPNYAPYYDPDNIRFPYWLQPVKKYTGAAWYQKMVTLNESWNGKRVFLSLERPHWQSIVWVNGEKVASQNSLATPHVYEIKDFIKVGENRITICIDNRTDKIDVGENSHSVSDHTQTNWNGIVGKINLSAKNNIYFKQVTIFPDIQSKSIEIEAIIENSTADTSEVSMLVFAQLINKNIKTKKEVFQVNVSPGENIVKLNYELGDNAVFWDEFAPNVYKLFLQLKSKSGTDEITEIFGLREIGIDKTRFTINGRPVFLRGTLECAIFPKTGYPATDIEYWAKIFTAIKAHGLNHVRFHSWCPPEAAFDAADKFGVYLQVECSLWANPDSPLGEGKPIDNYLWDESKRIVKAYGNHPSFIMMDYGNEPYGANYVELLTRFVNYWKEKDNRRLYTGASGWPVLDVDNYHLIPNPRIQGWGEELNSIINAEPPKTNYDWSNRLTDDGIPVVSHEVGQWCVYPNFKEIGKYTGVLKPKNFELFRESLNAHHMGELADSFLLASGKLQALCYKAEIEAALRTPGFAGFQLLDLHDFPGQGTALVGVLDAFWEEKGYISPEQYMHFCNSTVPLVRLDKRIFSEGDTMVAKVEIAHFGPSSLKGVNPCWKITSKDTVVANGTLGQRDIAIGNAISLGNIVYEFQKEDTPRKLTLSVSVGDFTNSWDVWVYPENKEGENEPIKVVETLNNETIQYLQKGGKVLLSLGKGKVAPEMGGEVGVGFSSIFWNTAWTNRQKPHTLGILCNPNHPALKYFPTEYHSNWQWWDAMSHADAIQTDSLSVELKPIVRIIDDWVTNRSLALIFEARVGKGSILVTGVDLVKYLPDRPEARQLKTSLLNYMKSLQFNPLVRIEPEKLKKIIR